MGFFSDLFKGKSSSSYSSNDIDSVTSCAQRLIEVINESLTIANDSNNPGTKISRLEVAKNKLLEIKKLSEQYSFLSLTSLAEVESSISELENEFLIAGYKEIANGNITAEALEKVGKIEEAIIEYEKLVEMKVDTPFTYRRLAILYRKNKQEKNEIRIINEALSNIPESNSKHYEWFKNRLQKMKSPRLFFKEDVRFNSRRINERNIDELIGMSRMIIADGKVDQIEAEALHKTLINMGSKYENPIVQNLLNRITDMLQDNYLDEKESLELLEILTKFTGDDFDAGELTKSTSLPLDKPEPKVVIKGSNFCFTGVFMFGARKDCKRAVENAGGFEVSLKKATDYLVIGNYATDSWIHSSYGRKIEKAMEMKQKGHHIKIISESHWVDFLD
jgi:NAD-dependent DNA ligase